MSATMDEQELKEIGLEVFELQDSKCETYPDCHDASSILKEKLMQDYDFSEEDVDIVEYMISDFFRHYVVKVRLGDSWKIVDCTFGQFSSHTSTPVNLGNDVEDVIVTDKVRYLFE